MELLDKIKNYNVKYKDDKPYFDIDGFIFFYYVLNNKNELFAICLNKPLIRLSDVKVINKQIKDFAKVSIDNIAFKNDLLFIELFEYTDIYTKLSKIKEVLINLNYSNRKSCILCGKATTLNVYKDALVPIDIECVDKLYNEEKDNANTNKKYFKKSFLLSLLGGLIGILPTILLNYVLGSYTIMSTILLFLSPFLTVVLFNSTPINRYKLNDKINFITSLVFVILYHAFVVFMYSFLYEVKSINHYFDIFNYLLLETLIETIFAYVLGLLSGYYIVKKRKIIRFSKKK